MKYECVECDIPINNYNGSELCNNCLRKKQIKYSIIAFILGLVMGISCVIKFYDILKRGTDVL